MAHGNIIASDRSLGLFVLTYDGAFPNCSGDFERVVEMDTTKYCYDTTTTPVAINRINTVEGFNVYPNPSKGEFHIQTNYNSPTAIIVYALDGKLINTAIDAKCLKKLTGWEALALAGS